MPSDIATRFNDSFIVLDKPKGPTSHQVDYWVREITGIQRVGHVGTLDPGVTGVLVMATGKAVKLIDIIHEQPKEYVCVMRLYHDVSDERLNEVFQEFSGKIYQIPPMRSAVARTLREREIYGMEIMERSDKLVLFRVRCESGTYIRTLCTDIGYALGVGAQMAELRRTSTGIFNEDGGIITLQELKDSVALLNEGKEPGKLKGIFPMDYPLKELPKIVVKSSSLKNISMGSDLFPGGIRAVLGNPHKGDRVGVYSDRNDLVGTGIMLVDYDSISDLKVVDFDRIMIPAPENPAKHNREERPAKPPEHRPRNSGKGMGERTFKQGERKSPQFNQRDRVRNNDKPKVDRREKWKKRPQRKR